MEARVVVPWRAGCEYRQAALDFIRDRHQRAGRTVTVGTHETGPWSKACAVASAITQVTDDLLIISDADCWTDGLDAALDAVRDGKPWAIPHRTVHRLTVEATAALLDGGGLGGSTTERPYKGFAGGGVVVIRRDVYEDCPLDPRFEGWGSEDQAWAHALTVLHGRPWRGHAPLWHLWHPPQPRVTRRLGSLESQDLLHRYLAARTPAAMRSLIGEVTCEPAIPPHSRRHHLHPDHH